MSFADVMGMPIRTFWSFIKSLSRLEAEEDMRALNISIAANNPEFGKKYADQLASRRNGFSSQERRFEEGDHSAGIARLRQIQGSF